MRAPSRLLCRGALLCTLGLVRGMLLPQPLLSQRALVLEQFDVEIHVDSSGILTVTEFSAPVFRGLGRVSFGIFP